MFYKETQIIKFLLLKNIGSLDQETGKMEYEKIYSSTFNYDNKILKIPAKLRNESTFGSILNMMYDDIKQYIIDTELNENELSLGLLIKIGDIEYENALSLQTLIDIKKYGVDDINPILEFYKMTYDKKC